MAMQIMLLESEIRASIVSIRISSLEHVRCMLNNYSKSPSRLHFHETRTMNYSKPIQR